MPTMRRRFTVSLDRVDYDALRELAAAQKPPLKLQYMVELSVQNLLSEYANNQLNLELRQP